MKSPIVYPKPVPVALPITSAELTALGINPAAHDFRGVLESFGPWQIPISYRALCVSSVYTPKDSAHYTAERESETIYGMRTLSKCRESGYCLEGRVSVNGKTVRGFTSSQLFEVTDSPLNQYGKRHLIDVATIHACID